MLSFLSILGVVIGFLTAVGVISTTAAAAEGDCDDPTITVVVEEAWTETIEHPAVVETQPDQRYSWNPQGPVDESAQAPAWPTPAQGKWQANTSNYNGTDPLNTVFQEGGGNGGNNGSFFYWTTKDVVVEEAWTETIDHPEVTEEQDNPEFPCVNPKPPGPGPDKEPDTKKPDTKKPDQKPTEITINKPDKQIKIVKDADGTVVDREVTTFEGPMIEEGL